jgi:hypothetical protein
MCWLQQSAELWRYPTFLLWPLLLIACIECFAGYHAWRFLLGVNGTVLGFIAGAFLGVLTTMPLLMLLFALAGAVAGAALFANMVPLGSVVFAFGSTASLVILIGRIAGCPQGLHVSLALFAGILAAIATLTIRRPVMIVLAAIAGAQQIAVAWTAWRLPPDAIPLFNCVSPAEWKLFLVLAPLGLLIQFVTSRPSSFPAPPSPVR